MDINCPGIYSPEQVTAWQKVTDAVHKNGGKIFGVAESGNDFTKFSTIYQWFQTLIHPLIQQRRIFLQLWHSGRVAHTSLVNGKSPVAPSAIAATGTLHTPVGKVTLEIPRAVETTEIPEIVEQFRQGAVNAMDATFDGVELHGAFGYLIDQFLQDCSNQRKDEYGGSVENREELTIQVVDAVCQVWGGDHVGIKLCSSNTFYGMGDSHVQ
ncbi:MAG: hypothetical protein HRU34_24590 [Richelia sp.]|nr:hypothetical protein [Richelia sp.]CDN11505.1 NADH:flavin oxidoreductases, Old Yellow Enzyme family [Richelia intracellularis]